MTKITAILSGGDWADASVDHVVLTVDFSINELATMHEKCYEASRAANGGARCNIFPEWLVEHGYARRPTADELEEFASD